jgi:Uma2 family endonuclease
LGVRLELVGGLPLWEAPPVYKHQKAIDRIRQTIVPIEGNAAARACVHSSNVYVSFPDGSLKRPDIAIFCREPDEEDEAITLIPEAVIEIISKGYEKKDLELGPPFYLGQGVKDVVVYDPYTRVTKHFTTSGAGEYSGTITLTLQCGCEVTL